MKDISTTATPKSRRSLKFVLLTFALFLAICGTWILVDLYGARRTNMRSFNPEEVARLETAMWRSYYGRKRLSLFNQLAETLRTQFNLPLIRSNAVAYRAAAAAFIFKDGHSRPDYEKALPDLVTFYKSIREVSNIDFDPEVAAKLELEWWIIHRERSRHPPSDLVDALAALQAEIYQVPVETLREHARLRAEAMIIRDTKAETGGVFEGDWNRIDELLKASWQSLFNAVNNQRPTAITFSISARKASTFPASTIVTPLIFPRPQAGEAITGTPRATASSSLRGLFSTKAGSTTAAAF
jgi:hypothetical protein